MRTTVNPQQLLPYRTEAHIDTDPCIILNKMHDAYQHYSQIQERVTSKAFVWLAEKPGCAPIYLIGTMHKVSFNVYDIFGDTLSAIIDKSNLIFTEIDFRNVLSVASSYPELFFKYQRQMDKIAVIFSGLMKKNLNHLENEEIREVAAAISKEQHRNFHEKTKPSKYTLQIYSEQYLTHVSKSKEAMQDNPKHPSITECVMRNLYWMPTLLAHSASETKPISVVVGSAHHAGKYGLPNLLASEGYTLTPLLKIAPPRKSALIYESVFCRKFEVEEANRAKAIIPRTRV